MEIDNNEEDNEVVDPGHARLFFHVRLLLESRLVGDTQATTQDMNRALHDVLTRSITRVMPNGVRQTVIRGWHERLPDTDRQMYLLPRKEGVSHRGYIIPTYGLCIRCKSAGPLGTLCPDRLHEQFPTRYRTVVTRNRLILDAEWMCNEIFDRNFRPVTTLTYPDEFYTNATVTMWSPGSDNMLEEIMECRSLYRAMHRVARLEPNEEAHVRAGIINRLDRLNYFEDTVLATF